MEILFAILRATPAAYVQGLFSSGLAMGIAYLLVWRVFKPRLQRWRIQLKERADYAQIRSEIKNALIASIPGALTSSSLLYLTSLGYTTLYMDSSAHGLLWSIAGIFVLWVIDDAWFYWVHRALHHKATYRFVHRIHHDSIDVTPFTSMSFHLAESFLLTAWFIPAAFLIPIWAPGLGVLQLIGLFNNIKSHLGYELYPAWVNSGPLRFLVTSTHHNMHHSKFQGNYGLHFRFWDRLCGTEFTEYSETFHAIKARGPEKAVVAK
jgi:sterol desaturase/sphingolipid hydroxylase (fatty acid hydroxylase superfamily)